MTYRVGCVSYINAKPLIEGLEQHADAQVRYDVPAALLDDLLSEEVDIALCPVMDYFKSPQPLTIVPAGCIGCDGPTFTVRLFSRVPIEQISQIHMDTESHTSVALLQVLLWQKLGRVPALIDYHARERVANGKIIELPQAMLLIGDKVVSDSPAAVTHPYQMDLGEAWKQLNHLPFVFAVWMTRPNLDLGDLPDQLAQRHEANLQPNQLHRIVEQYAERHSWPKSLALEYLRDTLRFHFGECQMQAMHRFGELLAQHGMLESQRPLQMYDGRIVRFPSASGY